MAQVTRQDFVARHRGAALGGSVWLPRSPAVMSVVMYPGSGAADRDNGSHFPPIRSYLLEHGCAVCSFDKRGVGESSGRWQDADIIEQARDVIAVTRTVRVEGFVNGPVALFGHSQGGWVVLEAASQDPSFASVVTSSGPGVSPGAQMRYAARCEMAAVGIDAGKINEFLRHFDLALSLMRDGVSRDGVVARLEPKVVSNADLDALLHMLPGDDEWGFARAILDYDPHQALTKIRVPLFAVFGADDAVVPVDASVRAFRESLRADLLRVEVFSGADHRIHTAGATSFADGYLRELSAFLTTAHTSPRAP